MLSLIEKRNRDFAARCREIIAGTTRTLTPSELAARAAESAAPCYYSTYDFARRTVTELREGRYNGTRPLRRKMWEEFDRKVRSFEARGQRIDRAVATVLTGGIASSFFISTSTALEIIRDLMRTDPQFKKSLNC